MAGVVVGVPAGAARASGGTLAITNACQNSSTSIYANLDWTLSGRASPSPITLGSGALTLTDARVKVQIPAQVLAADNDTEALDHDTNPIRTVIYVARQATNVDTGGGVAGSLIRKDVVSVDLNDVIRDSEDGLGGDGSKGPESTDGTATPVSVDLPLPDWTVTPAGGDVSFTQASAGSLGSIPIGPGGANQAVKGSLFVQSNVGLTINLDCSPGTTDETGPGAASGTSFTPAASIGAFEVASVIAPDAPPVCDPVSTSVGVSQTATIDLRTSCTDVNEGQGGGRPFTYEVAVPSVGTLTPTATAGVYSYTSPAVDPGSPVTFPYTATDASGLAGNAANIVVTVLANHCDGTGETCDLQEIIKQPIVGSGMTIQKVPDAIVMSPVTLDGSAQVSTGTLRTITVTNARGSAAAWSVTAYATDIGAAGSPSFTPLPGVTVPICSNAGAGPLAGTSSAPTTISSDRLCIPGDNLGWTPAAVVAHRDIPGDVATVSPGAASAADPAAWLAALVAAGNVGDPAVGADGLGGFLSAKTLCSAPVNHSGGTFTCDASLYLGVPASAGAGVFTGAIVLTLA
jgi:hypothetical protein